MSLADIFVGTIKIVFWPVIALYGTLTKPAVGNLVVTLISTIVGLGFAITFSHAITGVIAVVAFVFGLVSFIQTDHSYSTPTHFWTLVNSGVLLGIALRYLGLLA